MQRVEHKLQLAPGERDAWFKIRRKGCQLQINLLSPPAVPEDSIQLRFGGGMT